MDALIAVRSVSGMGQSKKKRRCPALNRDISSADCGQNRITRYACPADCEYNLFAVRNYDALLAVETELDRATLAALARLHADPAGVARRQSEARRMHRDIGEHAVPMRAIFFERNDSGQTVAERWLAARDNRLSNDERALLQGKMQARLALIEVRRIVDAMQFEAVDLLDPEQKRLHFVDRSLGAALVRFKALLVWIYPLPHFWRLAGSGTEIADIPGVSAREMVNACVRQLGGPAEPRAAREWLTWNFERVASALLAVGFERQRRMFATMDGKFGSAFYALEAPLTDCLAALESDPHVDRDELHDTERADGFTAARVWFGAAAKTPRMAGRPVLGRLVFKPQLLRADAVGGARLDVFRSKLEACLGRRIRFTSERLDDFAGRMLQDIPKVDVSLVPPELLGNTESMELSTSRMAGPPADVSPHEYMAAVRREGLRALLDDAVPLLKDLTPREAAAKPELRPLLLEWVKGLIRSHDRENLREGRTDGAINEFVRELGLSELDEPPPPVRPRWTPDDSPRSREDYEEDDDSPRLDEEDLSGMFGDRPASERAPGSDWSAPPLPSKPLSTKEARIRVGNAIKATPVVPAFGLDVGTPVFSKMAALLKDDLDGEDEMRVALLFVAIVWRALVPRGEVPLLRYGLMQDAYDREWDNLTEQSRERPDALETLAVGSPQPELVTLMMLEVVSAATDQKTGMTMKPDSTVSLVLALKVLIAELDHALRA